PLVVGALVGVQDSLRVGAADKVVGAHEVLLAGDSPIVPQQVHRVHVTVEQVPAALEESFRDPVAGHSGSRRLETRALPEAGQADRIVPAGVVTVDVEDLDRIAELIVGAAPVIAMTNLLEVKSEGFFALAHSRPSG